MQYKPISNTISGNATPLPRLSPTARPTVTSSGFSEVMHFGRWTSTSNHAGALVRYNACLPQDVNCLFTHDSLVCLFICFVLALSGSPGGRGAASGLLMPQITSYLALTCEVFGAPGAERSPWCSHTATFYRPQGLQSRQLALNSAHDPDMSRLQQRAASASWPRLGKKHRWDASRCDSGSDICGGLAATGGGVQRAVRETACLCFEYAC